MNLTRMMAWGERERAGWEGVARLGPSHLYLLVPPLLRVSGVGVLFSVAGGGRGWESSCSREDFNFLLGSARFLK